MGSGRTDVRFLTLQMAGKTPFQLELSTVQFQDNKLFPFKTNNEINWLNMRHLNLTPCVAEQLTVLTRPI